MGLQDFLYTCEYLIAHISPLVCVWVVVGQNDREGDAVLMHQGEQHADG